MFQTLETPNGVLSNDSTNIWDAHLEPEKMRWSCSEEHDHRMSSNSFKKIYATTAFDILTIKSLHII